MNFVVNYLSPPLERQKHSGLQIKRYDPHWSHVHEDVTYLANLGHSKFDISFETVIRFTWTSSFVLLTKNRFVNYQDI